MKTVQLTVPQETFVILNKLVKQLNTSRAAFARKALNDAISLFPKKRLENQHRLGYIKHPVRERDLVEWENEQVWIDS